MGFLHPRKLDLIHPQPVSAEIVTPRLLNRHASNQEISLSAAIEAAGNMGCDLHPQMQAQNKSQNK